MSSLSDNNDGSTDSAKPQSNAYDISTSSAWSSYVKFRPPYPPPLFDRIYAYHSTQGNGIFDTVHDAGCGPGVAAAVLARKFKHVVCSDFAAEAVESARRNLPQVPGANAMFTFRHSSAEDMDQWLDANSVDMVTMSECLHWTDIDSTTSAVSRVLKPGGTFAAWYYTDAHFPDNASVQDVYDEVLAHWVKVRSEWSKESERTLWVENSGYDCVDLPKSRGWRGVRRTKFNSKALPDRDCFQRDKKRLWMRYPSHVGEHDMLEFVEDAREWQFDANITWLRGWLESLMPRLDRDRLDEWMRRMEEILNRTLGKTRAVWPVVLLLATKSEEGEKNDVATCP